MPGEPDPGDGDDEKMMILPFRANGARFDDLPMQLEVNARLPDRAQLWLEGRADFMDALQGRTDDLEDNRVEGLKRIAINPRERHLSRNIPFPQDLREQMRLIVDVPEEARQQPYAVFVRQLYQDEEVGRVTWRLVPPREESNDRPCDCLRWLRDLLSSRSYLLCALLIVGLVMVILYLSKHGRKK